MDEIDGGSAQLIVESDTTVSRTINVSLSFSGDAVNGLDYEIQDTELQITSGSSRVETTINVLEDWQVETPETITVIAASSSTLTTVRGLPVSIIINDSEVGQVDKSSGRIFAFVFADLTFSQYGATVDARVYSLGRYQTPSGRMLMYYGESPDTNLGSAPDHSSAIRSLGPFGASFHSMYIPFFRLRPNQNYYIHIRAVDDNGDLLPGFTRDWLGFELNAARKVKVTCSSPPSEAQAGVPDPLFEHQWSLQNREQAAFAQSGGAATGDLNMDGVLASGEPTGDGVTVAIVDTGMDICHPDLVANVDRGNSYNFKVRAGYFDSWYNAQFFDPYQVSTFGDHGTSVAGIVGAEADNGIGLRGVAPKVTLRGYNYLTEQCCREDALGASSFLPNSNDVDIFNMSYGSAFAQAGPVSYADFQFYDTMTSTLRGGKGAIYVKAAGNSFGRCSYFFHSAHDRLGCSGGNNQNVQILPFLVNIGASNADDVRASYSTIGANLWVTAPSGQWGQRDPASITTDQVGTHRGYDNLALRGLNIDIVSNPKGNYISTFNGTSAAAPHASGAIALLLDQQPDLTWRDVKHVLAKSARKLDSDITPYRVTIGATPITLLEGWIENAAGYNFHNYYGFGAIDVDSALQLLSTYIPNSLGDFQESAWFEATLEESLAVPDNTGEIVSATANVTLGDSNYNIETVWVEVGIDHDFAPDLALFLTSPSGTRSVISQPLDHGSAHYTYAFTWTLASNAFYGENPIGTWTLEAVDVASGDTGTIDSFKVKVFTGQH